MICLTVSHSVSLPAALVCQRPTGDYQSLPVTVACLLRSLSKVYMSSPRFIGFLRLKQMLDCRFVVFGQRRAGRVSKDHRVKEFPLCAAAHTCMRQQPSNALVLKSPQDAQAASSRVSACQPVVHPSGRRVNANTHKQKEKLRTKQCAEGAKNGW
jgi:hypothetical protein